MSGGFLALVASIEMVLAMIVLIAAGSWAEPLLLIAWLGATLAIAWRYLQRNNVWTGARLGMTHELVEKMVGHRTRLAQERREHWHTGEDQALDRYIETSQKLDRAALPLAACRSMSDSRWTAESSSMRRTARHQASGRSAAIS